MHRDLAGVTQNNILDRFRRSKRYFARIGGKGTRWIINRQRVISDLGFTGWRFGNHSDCFDYTEDESSRESVRAEIRKRELLYTEFIDECSKLAIDALDHTLDDTTKFFHVYGLQSRISLTSSDMVVAAADQTVKHILKNYFGLPR